MAFIRHVIGEILDDLEATEDLALKTPARRAKEPAAARQWETGVTTFKVAAVAASGTPDALTLRMLGQILRRLEVHACDDRGQRFADAPRRPSRGSFSRDGDPVSSPSRGTREARYQVRRLRAQFAELPIVVGRWGEDGTDAASQGLSGVGATHVAFTLADARDQILRGPRPRLR